METVSVLLAVLSGAAYSVNGIFVKCFTRRFSGDERDSSSVYSIMLGLIIALVTWCSIGFSFKFSYVTLILAAVNCVGLLVHNTFIVKAMSKGPYSLISIFCMAGGIILPLVVTMVAYFDIPAWYQFVGIGIMFVAFGLLCIGDGDTSISDKKKYFIYLVVLFVANGLCSVGYTLEKRIEGGVYKQEMIIMEYLLLVAVALVMLVARKRRDTLGVFRQNGGFYLFAVLACVALALGNNLQVFSISGVSESVAFTAKNGSSIVISAILSLIIFSEKIRLKKWIAIGVAVLSICLLAIPK